MSSKENLKAEVVELDKFSRNITGLLRERAMHAVEGEVPTRHGGYQRAQFQNTRAVALSCVDALEYIALVYRCQKIAYKKVLNGYIDGKIKRDEIEDAYESVLKREKYITFGENIEDKCDDILQEWEEYVPKKEVVEYEMKYKRLYRIRASGGKRHGRIPTYYALAQRKVGAVDSFRKCFPWLRVVKCEPVDEEETMEILMHPTENVIINFAGNLNHRITTVEEAEKFRLECAERFKVISEQNKEERREARAELLEQRELERMEAEERQKEEEDVTETDYAAEEEYWKQQADESQGLAEQ